ncbi:MAG: hypothetical protein JNN06_17165 [Gemmobacter sp.]|nr:hypothetical protein [Gemmobacter sp.]
MAPRILIHAGFHKTGSSSVQAALRAHAAALAPHCAVLLADTPEGHRMQEAARLLSRAPGVVNRRLFRRAFDAWLGLIPLGQDQRLILSCEDLSGHMPGHPGIDAYAMAGRLASVAARAAREMWPGAEVWLAYGTRAPESWLASVYWQQAQHPHLTEDFAPFAARLRPACDFTALVAQIGLEADTPAIAMALERHGPRRLGPVEALYDLIALPDSLRATLAPVPPVNASGKARIARKLVALNRRGLDPEALTAAKRALLARGTPPGR